MKFQVREGFVCHISTRVDIGEGKFEVQTNTIYGGQSVDLDAATARDHAQKLEPKDKAAAEFLASLVPPKPEAEALNLTPEALALVKAMAAEMAGQIVAAMKAPAAA